MSCNCGAKNDNKVPCCCSQATPLVCTTTTCADAQVCDKTVESNCVIYTGPNISCSGVLTGMTVTQVINIILEQLNLINCSYCWYVTNDGSLSTTFEYVDADGATIPYPDPVAAGATVQVCGRSVDTTNVSIIQVGRCSDCNFITTTTTAAPPVSTRCTAGEGLNVGSYYSMERGWRDSTYTYTLVDMFLDGVQYATGQTITINPATDLVTATSTIDGLPYIVNLSDWLNSIAGFSTSGFMFHDDMHVIDKPTVASTYAIEIGMVSNNSSFTYYYSSTNGFEFGDSAGIFYQLGTYTCEPTLSVYSQVVSFSTPMNSIIYRCDGTQVAACYGSNQTNLNNLVNMFNSNPPVASNACFLGYGNYFNNGDGRVRLQIPVSVFNSLCPTGTLTLEVIYD